MTSVLPSQVDATDEDGLGLARALVVNNADASGERAAALQRAVWHAVDPADNPLAQGDRARRMIKRTTMPKRSNRVIDPAAQYDLGLRVVLRAYDHHLKTVDLRAVVRGRDGVPVTGMTVVLQRDDEPELARLTDDNGIARFSSVPRPRNDESRFVARVGETVPPGAVARTSDGQYLIVAEGYRLQTDSNEITESRIDSSKLGELFDEQGTTFLINSTGITLFVGLLILVVALSGLLASLVTPIPAKPMAGIALLGAVLAVIGILVFNSGSEPPVRPRPSADENRSRLITLPVRSIVAQSTFPANGCAGCNYEIAKTSDGSLSSAWVSAPDVSQGQSIYVDFGQTRWVTSIAIANGNQADRASYIGNGRVRAVEIYSDGGYYARRTVADAMTRNRYRPPGMNELSLATPILTRYLRLNLVQYTDDFYNVAISELAFRGRAPSAAHASDVQCTAVGYPDPSVPC